MLHLLHGASPRLRGKQCLGARRRPNKGCIPAPAGETSPNYRYPGYPGVHPRACGGNPQSAPETLRGRGASPRLRGKPPRSPVLQAIAGCIPAPAGETRASPTESGPDGVHPRACGGNSGVGEAEIASRGASPRLRGKPDCADAGGGGKGCIPAPAGETVRWIEVDRPVTVHPRACGGNIAPRQPPPCGLGASPRLRGKRGGLPEGGGRPGCIPAPAGETADRISSSAPSWVHPRACGGNLPVTIVTYSSQFTYHRPVLSLPALVDGFRGSLRTT